MGLRQSNDGLLASLAIPDLPRRSKICGCVGADSGADGWTTDVWEPG